MASGVSPGTLCRANFHRSFGTVDHLLTMPIIVNLDVVLAQRKMRLNDLADGVDITPQNLSVLKTGKAKAIRFSTLEAICKHLNCQPGDILEYRE
jgi:putative transcriptional regulator